MDVDASVNPGRLKSRVGIICRVHDGLILRAASIPVSACLRVEEAKALALLEGVKFSRDLGANAIKINSDSKKVVSLVNSKSPPLTDAGVFVLDFLDIASSLGVVACSFCYRSVNVVAHELMSFSISISSS